MSMTRKPDHLLLLSTLRAKAARAARKGDRIEAQHWTRLAAQHLKMIENDLKLAALRHANEEKRILNEREARFERERRMRGY